MKSKINFVKLEEKSRICGLIGKCTWLRVPEAAAYANMGESKMWELIRTRVIPSSCDGGETVVRRENIDKYWLDRERSISANLKTGL